MVLVSALLMPALVVAKSMKIEVEDFGKNRADAQRRVLQTAVPDALTRFMQEKAKDPLVIDHIKKKLRQIEGRHYKPLVRRWLLDIDEAHKGKHFMEGKIVLDEDVLKLWADEILTNPLGSGAEKKDGINNTGLKHRLSIYFLQASLDEVDLSNEQLAIRKDFMHALERRLISSGYDVKRGAQKRQAQYLLRLSQSKFDQRGLMGSMGFTVEILDSSDQSLLATADGYASASLTITSQAMRKELLQRASVKVASELERKFIGIVTGKKTTEIVFYGPGNIRKRRVRPVLVDGLADIYELDEEQTDALDENLQVTKDEDFYSFSFMIPKEYRVPHKRLKNGLAELHRDAFKSAEPEAKLTSVGQKWNICDEINPLPPCRQQDLSDLWAIKAEQSLRQGRLDAPPGTGQNALEIVKAQLEKNPADKQALKFLQRISSAFITVAHSAMDKEQYAQAGRYIDRADRVLLAQHRQLKRGQHEIKQARNRLAKLIGKPQPTAPPEPVKVAEESLLVFPDIEAKLRGFTRKRAKHIVGLASDVDGIDHITAGKKTLTSAPVKAPYLSFIKEPGAEPVQFEVPLGLASSDGLIDVVVIDTRGNTKKRTLRVENNKVSVLIENESEAGRSVIDRGRYWALLISNQQYTHGWNALETPHHDVDHLKQVLINNYRFDQTRVVVVKDATRQAMVEALDRMHDKVKGNDSLLIYFAGHGHQDKGYGGKGFWIPVNGLSPYAKDKPPRSTWLPNSQVHDILQASRAKHILLISDSCYSGTFKTRSGGGPSSYAANLDFFYKLAAKNSRRAITSGDLEPVSDSGAEGHSIFAYHLIKALEQKGRALNAKALFENLRNPIVKDAKQTPQYFTIKEAGDKGGDFIFAPRG
ncbi:MAG: caspase family protein [Gammaproteobacteria bacterium]|nr:caspase family protein [Gammaproteobacteria bacterium]